MKSYNVYMSGVGGQGIGMFSEALVRAADHAGYTVKAVDTHGLAQRGGIVVSQVRIGETVHTPLVSRRSADLVIALERHEAQRALIEMTATGGVLVFYDTVWQPLDVRLGKAPEVETAQVEALCRQLGVECARVFSPDLPDTRMQNIAVLACICRRNLIEKVSADHFRQAMTDLMAGGMLENNLALFDRELQRN
jgi:indolepyruvate ferredoxin oxidoreductase beta subunit